MGANLKVSEVGFHRKQSHPLSKLLRSLTAESTDAVEILVEIMNSKDSDNKIRLAAASKLLDLQRQIANDIEEDQLKRVLCNVKFGGPRDLEVDDDTPQIDFTQVIDV